MLLRHHIEFDLDPGEEWVADEKNGTYRCSTCGFCFTEYHYRVFCKKSGHPAIWRDRYAKRDMRRVSGAERYRGGIA